MVSVGIAKLGCTDLVFVDPGVKISGAYYRDVLLSKQLGYYPWYARYREFFVFNRTTPQHKGTWRCATSSLLLPDLWPANSPDLNPVDLDLDLERRPTASVPVAGAGHWRTETVCAASVALRRPEHHWQYNWRVAQASSCMRAGERRTLRAYAVENNNACLQSTIWQHKCIIFVKYDTLFDFFCCNLQ